MIDWNDIHREGNRTALQKLSEVSAIRFLLAGVYFLLGVSRGRTCEVQPVKTRRPVNRSCRLRCERDARLLKNNYRSTSHLRQFLPRGLSRNQFNERCIRLSHMGRFQIYDWLYYRWEFWRIGAVAKRCGSTLPVSAAAVSLQPLGLSAVHLGPD